MLTRPGVKALCYLAHSSACLSSRPALITTSRFTRTTLFRNGQQRRTIFSWWTSSSSPSSPSTRASPPEDAGGIPTGVKWGSRQVAQKVADEAARYHQWKRVEIAESGMENLPLDAEIDQQLLFPPLVPEAHENEAKVRGATVDKWIERKIRIPEQALGATEMKTSGATVEGRVADSDNLKLDTSILQGKFKKVERKVLQTLARIKGYTFDATRLDYAGDVPAFFYLTRRLAVIHKKRFENFVAIERALRPNLSIEEMEVYLIRDKKRATTKYVEDVTSLIDPVTQIRLREVAALAAAIKKPRHQKVIEEERERKAIIIAEKLGVKLKNDRKQLKRLDEELLVAQGKEERGDHWYPQTKTPNRHVIKKTVGEVMTRGYGNRKPRGDDMEPGPSHLDNDILAPVLARRALASPTTPLTNAAPPTQVLRSASNRYKNSKYENYTAAELTAELKRYEESWMVASAIPGNLLAASEERKRANRIRNLIRDQETGPMDWSVFPNAARPRQFQDGYAGPPVTQPVKKAKIGLANFNRRGMATKASPTDGRWSHIERTRDEWRDTSLHRVRVIDVQNATPSIRLIRLARDDGKGIEYIPGQWLDVHIPSLPKLGGFTLTSVPPNIELAIQEAPQNPASMWFWRDKDQVLNSEVDVRTGGSFTLPAKSAGITYNKILFVAGGVGVNPFMSIITYLSTSKILETVDITLIYSSKHFPPLFYDRLANIFKSAPRSVMRLFITSSDCVIPKQEMLPSNVKIVKEHMEESDVLKALGKGREMLVYICGPKGFTEHYQKKVEDKKGDKSRVFVEKWW